MSPPPSTPTPRRFLLAKRGTQSSQTPTGPPRFHSTPRFGPSSVLRPTQARAVVDIEDVEEIPEGLEEESSSSDRDERPETRRHDAINDSIEIESDHATTSQGDSSIAISDDEAEVLGREPSEREPSESPNLSQEASSPLEEREPKRRKVSISPMPGSSPLAEHRYLADENLATSEHTPTESSIESVHDAIPPHDETKAPQQPTFRAPPRFKPAEIDPTVEGLPVAFSPQRRGAKYVPGGLAAELQGWLSEVKGWEGAAPSTAPVIKVVIEEIRPGRRMYLVRGRTETSCTASTGKFLLAGEGRLTGLGQKAAVDVGSIVEVGQPVWDVELNGEVWTVACDWGVS